MCCVLPVTSTSCLHGGLASFFSCCLALDSSSSFPCPAFQAIAKSDQDCSLKIREPDVPALWFLDPGGSSKTAAVRLFFIFAGICSLSLLQLLMVNCALEILAGDFEDQAMYTFDLCAILKSVMKYHTDFHLPVCT
ncbi:hypothetical protein STEG23_035054 [Scotinomys teguina]